jgi:hypothetical protein
MSNISAWSTTAASNNTASPNGFPENMLPSGVNDSAREVMAAVRSWYEGAEWINLGHTPVFVSTTSFTIATDVTATYHVGRRLKFTDASTLYGTIATSVYGAPNTTITVTLDSGVLSVSLSAVATSILSNNNKSVPVSSLIPAGVITAWNPGYYANGANGGYTFALGSANTVAAANAYLNPLGYYVCDGAALNDSLSPIFSGAGRYLPNLTDSRFLMGSTTVGAIGGSSTMDHTHTGPSHTHTGPSHTHSGPSHTHSTLVEIDGWGYSAAITGYLGSSAPNETARVTSNRSFTSSAGGTGLTGAEGTGATGAAGTGNTGAASVTENRPLYLSCFYIIKVH